MLSQQLNLFGVVSAISAPAPKKKQLRKYQRDAIDNVIDAIENNIQKICLALPTGAGKTVVASTLLIELAAMGFTNQLALVPRRKIGKQMRGEFFLNGINPKMVKTAQSITDKKLMAGEFDNLSVIILDECHELAWWEPVIKLQSANPNAIIIGLTATPDRTSKKEFFEDKFDKIIYPVTFGDLVADGHLCNPTYYAYGDKLKFDQVGINLDGDFIQEGLDKECEKDNFNEFIVEKLLDNGVKERKSIVFCSSIKQSKLLTELLSKNDISAIHVDGSMSEKDQDTAIGKVANGDIAALCCAKLLIAGFDEPSIDTVVLATATTSKVNLVQMCGRGSRLHPDKGGQFKVFDFGDNFARFAPFGLKQAFPTKTREDTEIGEAPMKPCLECGTLNFTFVKVCKDCGYIFPVKKKPIQDLQTLDIVEVAADLQDMVHMKMIRKIIRESYLQDKLFFIEVEKYGNKYHVPPAMVLTQGVLTGCIYKTRSLEHLLELKFYCDKNIYRFSHQQFTKEELSHLNKNASIKQDVISGWVKFLTALPDIEFTSKFTTSKSITKHLYKARWQDVLGVMDISTRADMEESYRRRWRAINHQIEQMTSFSTNGQINPDGTLDFLKNNESQEIKYLRNEILVLEWAWQYVNLIYS